MEYMTCTKCGEIKPIVDFCSHKKGRTGYKNPCRACHNALRRIWEESNSNAAVALRKRKAESQVRQEKRLVEMACTACKINKPLSDFFRNPKARNGRVNPCKACRAVKASKAYFKNRDFYNEIQKTKKAALRAEILQAYGGRCACCGEDEPKFLAVDHIQNNGNKHRAEIGRGNYYHWLKKNGFPKDNFQLLCHNCNFSKGAYGACPHKTQTSAKSSHTIFANDLN